MTGDAITFEATYDEAGIDYAAKAIVEWRIRKYVNTKFIVNWIVMALGYAAFLAFGLRGWIAIAWGVLIVASAAYWPIIYLWQPKPVARQLRKLFRPSATFKLDRSQFTIQAQGDSATWRWIELKEIVELPRVFLLIPNRFQVFIVPKAEMPESAAELTRESARILAQRK